MKSQENSKNNKKENCKKENRSEIKASRKAGRKAGRENSRKDKISMKEFFLLTGRLRLPWFWIAVTFFVNLAYNKLLYTLPVSTGRLLNGDLSSEALRETLIYYGAYALIVVIQASVLAFTDAVTSRNARISLWGKMLKINEAYYNKVSSSEMISAVTTDISEAMPRLVNLFVAVIPDVIYVGKAAFTIFSYDSSLLLVMLVFLPMKYLYMLFVGRRFFRLTSGLRDRVGTLTATLGERMDNLQLVKSFNQESEELARGRVEIEGLYKANVRIAKLDGLSAALENGILVLQQFACMVAAVFLMQQGRITMAEWITFFLFFSNISTKFSALIADWMSLKMVTGILNRTNNLAEAPSENMAENGRELSVLTEYDLSFEDVSFAYEGDQALSHISFRIPEGQKTAIVGTCGSGKSTALALMERFYEPDDGVVRLGGIDVRELRMKEYREKIAYVPQSNQIFTSSIREALTYGNTETISDAQLLAAAESTGFGQYLSLQQDGLDTLLLNGGQNMSGGQLQKLVITREILKQSKIVLFDEPTSALDAQSSRNVKEMLMHQFEEKTVIVVTHDLSLIDEMDQIILLHDGDLVMTGSFRELMENCADFRRMVNSQMGREEAAL